MSLYIYVYLIKTRTISVLNYTIIILIMDGQKKSFRCLECDEEEKKKYEEATYYSDVCLLACPPARRGVVVVYSSMS